MLQFWCQAFKTKRAIGKGWLRLEWYSHFLVGSTFLAGYIGSHSENCIGAKRRYFTSKRI